jgi:hypothetical protein
LAKLGREVGERFFSEMDGKRDYLVGENAEVAGLCKIVHKKAHHIHD